MGTRMFIQSRLSQKLNRRLFYLTYVTRLVMHYERKREVNLPVEVGREEIARPEKARVGNHLPTFFEPLMLEL